MKSSEWARSLRPVFLGTGVMLLLSMVLAGMFAVLLETGRIPAYHLEAPACGIAVLSALTGAWLCGKTAPKARLPLCLAAWGLYLLLAFALRGLIFRSLGEQLWRIPLWGSLGCLAGAVAAAGSGKRRPRRR